MPYHSRAVANHFLDLAEVSGKKLDPMQIQKLVYFGHGWHLAFTDDPLIDERIEAWTYGPVVPTLYHELKVWGSGEIRKRVARWVFKVNPNTGKTSVLIAVPSLDDPGGDNQHLRFAKALLRRTWDVYGRMSGVSLSQLTHEPGGPWDVTRRKNPEVRGADIPDELIRDHFKKKLKANRDRANATAG